MENGTKKYPLSKLSVDEALRRVVKRLDSDSEDDSTDDDFFLTSDEEERLDALSDPVSDVEQDADTPDSDDHSAVEVVEEDGEFALPRRVRGRCRAGCARGASRCERQVGDRRGAPGAARAATQGVLAV